MKFRKIFVAAAAAVMTFSAAGCGGGGSVMETAAVEELLTLSQETMATVESMAAEITMEMDMAMGEEAIETTTVANILTKQDPMQMQMDMYVVMEDGSEAQQMMMYAEEAEGKLRTYMYSADTWYAQTMEIGDLGQYDAEASMELYLNNIESFTATAEEDINGTKTTRIEGIIARDAMEEAIQNSGVADSAASLGVTEEQMQEMYADMGDLPIVLWIDAEGYVLKYEMDMTEMMQKIMDTAMGAVGETETEPSVSITKTSISMICSDFNNVEEIVIPAEAKSASFLTTEE
ncbi:DUF6612 family protein [Anaerotignum sp.]|nr:DUF6612 family protein [Anaerotignum sp.]MBQ7758976.1 hypothetical protein [Anaerotignum sp.]